MKNKYCKHSRLTERQFRLVVNGFAGDMSAAETAEKIGLTRKSVNNVFLKIRKRIYEHCLPTVHLQLSGPKTRDYNFVVSTEMSLRSPKQKSPPIIFCALISNGRIQTDIIYASDPAVFKKLETAIQNIMDRRILDFGFSDTRFRKIPSLYYGFPSFHLNYSTSVKQFRDFALPIFVKRRGIRSDKLILHLKECEWRFNNRKNAFTVNDCPEQKSRLYLPLLEILRKKPNKTSAKFWKNGKAE